MTRACAQTTGPRIRISRHDGASARCSVSNRPDPPSVSCPFTPPSTTHSTSSAISPPAARFASSETKRSGRGEPPPRPEHELGTSKERGAKFSSRDSACWTPRWADSASTWAASGRTRVRCQATFHCGKETTFTARSGSSSLHQTRAIKYHAAVVVRCDQLPVNWPAPGFTPSLRAPPAAPSPQRSPAFLTSA
jgi:hypothetical protein